MSDIQLRHGPRPLPRSLSPVRARQRRAQARRSARLGGGRRRRRPRGRRRARGEAGRARGRRPRSRRGSCGSTAPARRWFEDDLALVAAIELDAIVLPKATPEARRGARPGGPPVIAIVETAQGLRLAYETASCATGRRAHARRRRPRRRARARAARRTGSRSSTRARRVVVDSGRGRDPAAVRHRPPRDRGRRGARGSSAASPARSASAARRASTRRRCRSSTASFAPSEREVAWARRVVDAYEAELDEGGVLALERRDDRPARRRAGAADPGRGGKEQRMSRAGAQGLARPLLRGLRRSATSSGAGSAGRSPRWTTSGSPA